MNDEIRMTNDELPRWNSVRLADLTVKVGSGSTPRGGEASYQTTGIPLIRSMNVVFFGFKRKGLAYINQKQATALDNVTVQTGDVLLNITGASIGRVTVAPADMEGARVNQHVCIIRPSPALEARFLNAFLSGPIMQNLIYGENYGVTRQALTKQQILDFEIPLPPLSEQKRIADKLDALLGRVDACRSRLDRVPALLKRFRQSVLAAATSGKLTAGWRMTNGEKDEWKSFPLGTLCQEGRIITYGVIKLGNEIPTGVPCLRTSNVRWLRIDTEGMKRIEERLSKEYSRTILEGGEVLVNVRGTLGGVAVAEDHMAGWNVSREVAVVPVKQGILLPKFLAFWIGSDSSQAWLTGVQKGVAYTGINIEDLRLLPIGVPSLTEQQEIVRRVETLFAIADRIEARLATAQKTVERLTPATLAKAFRGELVPQDPNDEPASRVLERLKSAGEDSLTPMKRKARFTKGHAGES